MSDNPREFSSIDSSDANLHGSLTNRPASGVPAGDPIDLEALNRQVINQRTQQDYVYKESSAEYVLRREREIAAAQRVRQETADARAAQALQAQRNQNQRNELSNRINNNTPTDPGVGTPAPGSQVPQPRSTPERQPPPSTGSPPPTPRDTAARANSLVEPTATPTTGSLKQAISNGIGAAQGILPRALPQSAGRLVIPGVGAGLVLTSRLVAGQSIGQAVTGTAGTLIGSGAGLLVGTAIGGPIGGVVGSMIGGFVGGYIGDALYASFLPKPVPDQPLHRPNYTLTIYGQSSGVLYVVIVSKFNSFGELVESRTFELYGSIIGIQETAADDNKYNAKFLSSGGNVITELGDSTSRWKIDSIRRKDGAIDIYPENGSPAPPPDNAPYRYDPSPIGNDNTVPSGTPVAGANKGISRNVAPSLPSNNIPNGAPFFTGHGGLAPSYLPNPTQTPSNLGGLLPSAKPAQQPPPFAEPDDIATPTSSAGTGSRIENGVVTQPKSSNAQLIPLSSSRVTVPGTSSPTPGKQIPTPDGISPTPKADGAPSPKTPQEVQADQTTKIIEQQKKDFDDQIGRITAIATAIAALTPAIQGIPDAIAKSPAVQAATGTTVQSAVCEIAQPNGCLGAPIQRAEDAAKANGNKLNDILTGLNTAGSAAQLALLDTINGKLGDQLPGGIGGKLSRFADWMHLDRVLNILILAATFHNALMLSNDIGQTLVGAINNLLQLIGLKKEDGSAFDIGSVISGSIENLIKGAIGADNYTELKEAWAKANRIYQATTNVINSFLNLSQTILQASELIAAYTGKIGNALRKGGIILESAYGWMNPQPKFNRVTQTLESLQNGASTIQMVTQAPLDVVNAVTESTTAATEFVKAVKEDDKPANKATPIPEPDELKAKETQSKTDSQPLNFDFSDLFDGED
ncbi:hypothetical protein GNF10_17375 [Nostoc sp. UCD121]|uniref:hypothetical protein n=1 Tax=unclassified Nostoc TaxID=2593658 RepID=UPI0016281901|nr:MULTISPECIES: hypothetical protein [unclassified Nostoc]MBC1218482.1 hypothetical protein [Nostoc sp. UCD120]MBC1277680.1 hypothetical protein [Nostoc sp. UCD121]MBC1296200.1 hypothetical protein [Nostoc sp. UCD122]